MKKIELFCVGTPVIDYYTHYDRRLMKEIEKEYRIKKNCTNYMPLEKIDQLLKKLKIIKKNAGDNAKNVAVAYKVAGGKSCIYSGILGTDLEADFFKESLKKHKILDWTIKKNGKTGKIICLIDKFKQRTFIADLGVGVEKLNLKNLPKTKLFFCTNITLIQPKIGKTVLKIIKKLKKEKVKIALALESENLIKQNISKTLDFCKHADYIFLNEYEMNAFGKKKDEIKKMNAIIFLKAGKKGVKIINNKGCVLQIKAKKIRKVKDTTGAGDFFAGGALFGIIKEYSLKKIGRIGNELAAKVIKKIGVEPDS